MQNTIEWMWLRDCSFANRTKIPLQNCREHFICLTSSISDFGKWCKLQVVEDVRIHCHCTSHFTLTINDRKLRTQSVESIANPIKITLSCGIEWRIVHKKYKKFNENWFITFENVRFGKTSNNTFEFIYKLTWIYSRWLWLRENESKLITIAQWTNTYIVHRIDNCTFAPSLITTHR